MNQYQDKHELDLTSEQEPDYMTHFSKHLDEDEYYSIWSEQQQASIVEMENELNG